MDASDSVQRCQDLIDLALHLNYGSSTGHALQGLADLLVARQRPGARRSFLAQAEMELLITKDLGGQNRLCALLRQALSEEKRSN